MKKFLIFIFILIIIISCNHINDPARDSISFPDGIDTVQNALYHILNYMDSMSLSPDSSNPGDSYIIDGEYLYVSNFKKRKISDTMIIPGLSASSSFDFIQTILFLKRNHITSGYKSFSNDFWYFDYRKLSYEEFETTRDIVLIRGNSDTLHLSDDNKIIDQKKNILLVAAKLPPKTHD